MLACEVIWAPEKAARARELIEDAIGGPCPCHEGRECPMLPEGMPLHLRLRDGARLG